jgi:hypothetical protein
MLERKAVQGTKIETEQPVLLAIMSKAGYMLFSNSFTADLAFDDNRLGNLVSTFNAVSDQVFDESLDRAKFGDFTVLLKVVDTFTICYVFRGQSYSALKKLNNFAEDVKDSKVIMDILYSSVRSGEAIKVQEHPNLEQLISNSFLSSTMNYQIPFEAYEGNDPHLFVSYVHTDRLQVYPIIDYLDKKGIKIWYDEGIPISENWRDIIVDNIEKCSGFLVFITPNVNTSEYVRKEINFALKRKKRFFAVYLKDTKLPASLEFELDEIQSMKKFLLSDEEFLSKLHEIIIPVLKN